MQPAFHEIRFPLALSLGGSGGPERKTDIIETGSGREERIARWANSRRSYDAGSGVKTLSDLADIVSFFEERRGRLYGFRWRDRVDCKSCVVTAAPSASDQLIGMGDGVTARFQLTKTYGGLFAPYARLITKPVAGTVRVSVNGVESVLGRDAAVDATTGIVSFAASSIPRSGATVKAGFEFDVPVRFDSDTLAVDFSAFSAGEIPKIPLIEILP